MKLYKDGKIVFEDMNFNQVNNGYGEDTHVTGKIINHSYKTIKEARLVLKMKDNSKGMVYKENWVTIYETIPPNQFRPIADTVYTFGNGGNQDSYLQWGVHSIRVSD